MKKIITFIVILTLSIIAVGCSTESKEPIEYEIATYNLDKVSEDLIFEGMLIGVNTDKLSEEEAIKITEDVVNKKYSPRIKLVGLEDKLIAEVLTLEDDSIHVEFEHDKEGKSNRDIKNITDKKMYDWMVEKAVEKIE